MARKILLDQLTGRARTRSELADKLAGRNVPDDVASRLLDRFEEVGLVDDAAFAREWVEQRQSGRGLAKRALAQELRRKGIDDEVAREALDEIDADDEVEVARALVRARLRSVRNLDRERRYAASSACSPARATRPASPSGSSRRSWIWTNWKCHRSSRQSDAASADRVEVVVEERGPTGLTWSWEERGPTGLTCMVVGERSGGATISALSANYE